MSENNKLVLYTYFRSSTSWRVRITLNLKKIPHEFKFVNLLKGQQTSQQYQKVNPNVGVPALQLPTGEIIVESMAICEYLQQVYPDFALLPKDPIRRGQVRAFCEVINSGMHPYQNLRLLNKVSEQYGGDKMAFAKSWVLRGMATLQKMLPKTRGKYCFGDQITLADTFFYPQVQGGIARFGVQITEYPNCQEVLKNLAEIDEFRLAQPKNQPDFVA